MAFDTNPWILDGTTVDAEVIRRALGTLIGTAGGIISGGDLTVTQNGTPNMSVNVGTGQIWVPGRSTASTGPYYGRNGASINVSISAANATNPRIDTIVIQVEDPEYGGSGSPMAPAVLKGTATAGATLTNLTGAATVPATSSCYVIAYVLVPANATTITTGDISNVASAISRNLGRNSSSGPFGSSYNYLTGAGIQVVGAFNITIAQPTAYLHITGGMSGAPVAANGQMTLYANVDSTSQSGAGMLGLVYMETASFHKWASGSVIMGPYPAGTHTINLLILPQNQTIGVTAGADGSLLTVFEMPN